MTDKTKTTDSIARGFIKLMRHEDVERLITQKPHAFRLLTIIAWRARRSGETCKWTNLECGQAFIGDYKSCGFTEATYRSAKRQLAELNFATFKGTNKGTTATLSCSTIYDINPEARNELGNDQKTDKKRSKNGQATTNKNVKKEKNDNKDIVADAPERSLECSSKSSTESEPKQQHSKESPLPPKTMSVPPDAVAVAQWAEGWAKKKKLDVYTAQKIAEEARMYYDRLDWKDSNGRKVKAWKQKIVAVWMKPEKFLASSKALPSCNDLIN